MWKSVATAAAAVGLALAFNQPAAAQEHEEHPQSHPVIGQWELSFETPRGTRTLSITFEMDGDAFKGTAQTQRGTVELQDVRVEGDQVSFAMPFGRRGGQGFTMRFTGTVSGDTMDGRMQLPRGNQERPWTAKRVEGE